jgi:S-adenosylmethionine-diacylglycerol 3-amino-3-carboxypropyl transferase
MSITEWLGSQMFGLVHRHNLVYNTCWEDPRLDHAALRLTPEDRLLVITGAGCNTLDYALAAPARIDAVDLNPRQNALLELKLAGIKHLEFDTFFQMFGRGRLPGMESVYRDKLRPTLSAWSQRYWDRKIGYFDGRRPFYFRGTSGTFARMLNVYVDRVADLRPWVDAILEARDMRQQREIYENHIRDRFWTPLVRFCMRRDTTLSLVGVPRAQRDQIDAQFEGGIICYLEECMEAVFGRLPLADNYFWRVYLTGRYLPQCCPEYLKPENFERLKAGLVDCIHLHTDSVQGFLEKHREPITRFVLLDHMDWLSGKQFPLLEAEWQAIVRRAAPCARLIWRSGGLRTEFVDRAEVTVDGRRRQVGELLAYDYPLAQKLHERCRVHTYGSFHIADLAA